MCRSPVVLVSNLSERTVDGHTRACMHALPVFSGTYTTDIYIHLIFAYSKFRYKNYGIFFLLPGVVPAAAQE